MGKIRSALSEVSDISDVGMPDSNGVFDIHEQMDSDLIKLVSNVNSYERENVVRLENSVELLLENLQSCLSKIGLSQGAIESYETGSFITGKDAGTLNTGIKIFGDLHEKNKEAYDEIYETEQKIKDDRKCLCICGIRNDSNRTGIHSGKSDIQKHSNNSRQRRHLNGSRSRCAEDNHRCDRK